MCKKIFDEITKLQKPRRTGSKLTKEQYEVIRKAREHDYPVSWVKISELLKKHGLGDLHPEHLRKMYARYEQ